MKTKSAIRQMYFGEKGTYEDMKTTSELDTLSEIATVYDEEMREKLKEHSELSELYHKTEKALRNMYCEETTIHYIEGFKFGLRMGMEAADDTDDT